MFAIVIPSEIADHFKSDVASSFEWQIIEEDSESYYSRVNIS